jgi:PAS domain-containing protein
MVAVTLGPRHVYSFVNRLAAQVAGRPAESLVGKSVREAYPDLDERFAAALDQVYANGVPWAAGDAIVKWTHLNGTSREGKANLMFQPLRDAEGRVVGLLHIGAEAAEA